MPQVRCPRCGAINSTRAPGYPFCLGCQENLARCGYCRFFDEESAVCTHPLMAGVFEVSADATPPCAHHTSRKDLQIRRRWIAVLVGAAMAAAVFALGYGLLGLFSEPAPVGPKPKLELAVEADYRAPVVGEPYTVEVLIYNRSGAVVEDIGLGIRKDSLDALYMRAVRPKPVDAYDQGDWRVLSYPDINPWERRRVALELVPKRVGIAHLVVRLRSGEKESHGECDLPITVSETEDETEPLSGRAAEESER